MTNKIEDINDSNDLVERCFDLFISKDENNVKLSEGILEDFTITQLYKFLDRGKDRISKVHEFPFNNYWMYDNFLGININYATPNVVVIRNKLKKLKIYIKARKIKEDENRGGR